MNKIKYKKSQGGVSSGRNIPEVMYKRHGKHMVDVTELIRSIQRREGNPDCFRRPGKHDCNQNDCAWRLYCTQT